MKKINLCRFYFIFLFMSALVVTFLIPSFTQAGISSAPVSVNFGSISVGTSSAATVVTITNTGSVNLVIDQLDITGANNTEFSIGTTDTCSNATVAPSGNCTAEVVFSPDTVGAKSASLSMPSDDPLQNPFDVPLSGTGVILTPDISVIPATINFGSVNVSTSSEASIVTVSNTGTGDLLIGTLSLTGINNTEFSIGLDGCSDTTLSPSENCTTEVDFSPDTEGAKSATLSIPSDDPDENPVNVPLTGTGAILIPDINVVPTSHDFGGIEVDGYSDIFTFTVTNTGTGDLTLGTDTADIMITGTNGLESEEFFIEDDTCTGSVLAPSESCEIQVDFWPFEEGAKSATLSIPSDDPDENPVDVSLTGQGVITPPDIDVTPTSLAFGNVNVDESSEIIDVTVSNVGLGPLNIDEVLIGGLNPLQFSIEDDECSAGYFETSETCIVSVAFVPTAGGAKQAKLIIKSDDPDENPLNVPLTGTGIIPCTGSPEITKLSNIAAASFTEELAAKKPPTGLTATFGDNLTITGSGFCDNLGTVSFSGIEADNIISWADTKITVAVPWGLANENINVKVVSFDAVESNIKTFLFLNPPKPKITSLSDKSKKIAEEIEITGTNFGNKDAVSAVMFGKIPADDVTNWSNGSITVKVPAMSAGKKGKTVSIKVSTTYGKSKSKKFKVLP